MRSAFVIFLFVSWAAVANSSRFLEDPPSKSLSSAPLSSPPAESPSSVPPPAGSPGPSAFDCQSFVIGAMGDCLSYLMDSNDTLDPNCCKGFESVIDVNPKCICEVLKTQADIINMTRATGLPNACGVSTPPLSQCDVSLPPSASAPAGPPGSSPLLPPPEAAPPTGGNTPAPPTGGEAPTPPTGGEAPTPPTGGEAPTPPNGGDAPNPPNVGEAPSGPSVPQAQPPASAPAKGGTYSISISVLVTISLLLVSFFFILV